MNAQIANLHTRRRSGEPSAQNAEASAPGARGRSLAAGLLVAILLLAEIAMFQTLDGAYQSEFGGFPDEPAHYVTGLMFRDYLLHGGWCSPRRFAEQYYAHYPKIGIGHWPPCFYGMQAIWTTVFGDSHVSLKVFMASQLWLLCMVLWCVMRRCVRPGLAAAAVVILVALPITRVLTAHLMTEVTVALLCLVATLLYHRHMQTGSLRMAIGFAIIASIGIMTKGSGLLLAFVPPLYAVLGRRWDLFVRPVFYLPAVLVVGLCAPWYIWTLDLARDGWEHEFGLDFTLAAVRYYPVQLFQKSGLGLSLFLLLGVATLERRQGEQLRWPVAFVVLLLSTLLSHFLIPCGLEWRHLMPAIVAVIVLAVVGVDRVASLLPSVGPKFELAPWLMLASAVGLSWPVFQASLGPSRGFSDAVSAIDDAALVFLVSSDATGEGMFIAQIAHRDTPDRRRFALRSSRMLTTSDWNGAAVEVLHKTPEAINKYLLDLSVDYVVLDHSVVPKKAALRQHTELLAAMREHKSDWSSLGAFDRVKGGVARREAIEVFRRTRPVKRPSYLRVPMQDRLGHDVLVPVRGG